MSEQKPKSQNADLANLPAALAPLCRRAHWVLWRWVWRFGKWTKPPFMPNGANAESDDPSTWSGYSVTLEAMHRANGSIDGLGFMLRKTGLTTVDLDHCLDREGRPDPWAALWLESMDGAYVERTPSGEGLRIIGIGRGKRLQRRWTIKNAPHPDAAIEIYRNCERYITITGAQISGGAKLQRIDASPIVAHYDAIKKAAKDAKAKNGSKNGADNKTGTFDFNETGASIDYDEVIRNGAPTNSDRSALFQSCVWHLTAKGRSVEEIVDELAQYPHGIGEKYTDRLRAEVERSYAKWRAEREPQPAAGMAGKSEEPSEDQVESRVENQMRTPSGTRSAGAACPSQHVPMRVAPSEHLGSNAVTMPSMIGTWSRALWFKGMIPSTRKYRSYARNSTRPLASTRGPSTRSMRSCSCACRTSSTPLLITSMH
jgi:hypothetical protein